MEKIKYFALLAVLTVLLAGCSRNRVEPEDVIPEEQQAEADHTEGMESTVDGKVESGENRMYITVGNTMMTMTLADNASAEAFRELASSGPFTVETNNYGGFEQVGSLEKSLPVDDEQITTEPGDVMLYQGNSVTIFYGTNSWSYTRLGKIADMNQEELLEVFGNGDVAVTFSLGL